MANLDVEYGKIGGTVLFRWRRADFPKIAKTLDLSSNQLSFGSVKNYVKKFDRPCQCKVMFYENGRVILSGAQSAEKMQQILDQCIITKLIEELPQVQISVIEQLSITNSSAKIRLPYKLDINKLQQYVQKQFQDQVKGSYVFLPYVIHKIEKVTVFLNSQYVKITRSHLIQDLSMFMKYLAFILIQFPKASNQNFVTNLEYQWKQLKKMNIRECQKFNLNKYLSKNEPNFQSSRSNLEKQSFVDQEQFEKN